MVKPLTTYQAGDNSMYSDSMNLPTAKDKTRQEVFSNMYSEANKLAMAKENKAKDIIDLQTQFQATYETPKDQDSGKSVQKIKENTDRRVRLETELKNSLEEYNNLNNQLYVVNTRAYEKWKAYETQEKH